MTYLFGYLSRKAGRKQILLASLLGSTLFLFLLGIARGLELALISLFLYGASLFLIFPAFQSFVGNEVPEKNQAQAFSLVANIQMLTGATVVLVAGFLSDKFGIYSPFLMLGTLGILISFYYFVKGFPARKVI